MMRMPSTFAVALIALGICSAPACAQARIGQATVNLEVIQCPVDRSEVPRVEFAAVSSGASPSYSQATALITKLAEGLFRLTTSAPAGNLLVRVESIHCSATMQVGLLAGHTRTLSAALSRNAAILFPSRNVLMGTIPVRPGVMYLISARGTRRVVDVQNGAYYIERVYPGKFTLLLELSGGFQSEIPLDLSAIGPTETVRHDLDIKTIRDHLGETLLNGKTDEECLWCY